MIVATARHEVLSSMRGAALFVSLMLGCGRATTIPVDVDRQHLCDQEVTETPLPVPEGPYCGDGKVGVIVEECFEVCSGGCGSAESCEERCYSRAEACDAGGESCDAGECDGGGRLDCATLGFASGEMQCRPGCEEALMVECEPCPASVPSGVLCSTFRADGSRGAHDFSRMAGRRS